VFLGGGVGEREDMVGCRKRGKNKGSPGNGLVGLVLGRETNEGQRMSRITETTNVAALGPMGGDDLGLVGDWK